MSQKNLGKVVPAIIISAYGYSDIQDDFQRAGADAFITKALLKSKILQVLQLFIDCGGNPADGEYTGGCSGKRPVGFDTG